MKENRAKELLEAVLGFIEDRFEFDGLVEISKKIGLTPEELSELGWGENEQS